ncbi:hypothetical protein CR513_35783, partial [Mucuna pruriens]
MIKRPISRRKILKFDTKNAILVQQNLMANQLTISLNHVDRMPTALGCSSSNNAGPLLYFFFCVEDLMLLKIVPLKEVFKKMSTMFIIHDVNKITLNLIIIMHDGNNIPPSHEDKMGSI